MGKGSANCGLVPSCPQPWTEVGGKLFKAGRFMLAMERYKKARKLRTQEVSTGSQMALTQVVDMFSYTDNYQASWCT